MSFPEIVSLILMAIVALQAWFIRYLMASSMETMRSCSETSQMAMDLSQRVLVQGGYNPPPIPRHEGGTP